MDEKLYNDNKFWRRRTGMGVDKIIYFFLYSFYLIVTCNRFIGLSAVFPQILILCLIDINLLRLKCSIGTALC